MKTVWIPEAPDHPGLYANLSGNDLRPRGKLQDAFLPPSTMDPRAARHFETKEQCEQWCADNPVPKFVPSEHGCMDARPYVSKAMEETMKLKDDLAL